MKNILILSSLLCLLIFTSSCGSSSGTSATPTTVTPGTTAFTVINNGMTSYLVNNSSNAAITLQRGQTYTFTVSSAGHPFYIMSVQGTNTANAYTSGVTGNGATSGTLTFTVPMNAPNTLYYDCSVHSAMTGVITITN